MSEEIHDLVSNIPSISDIGDAYARLVNDRETRDILQQMVDAGLACDYGLLLWKKDGLLDHIKIKKDLFPEGVQVVVLPCSPEEYSRKLMGEIHQKVMDEMHQKVMDNIREDGLWREFNYNVWRHRIDN